MEYQGNASKKSQLDCLLVFVPKLKNFYRPIGEHMFSVLLPMGLLAMADFIHREGFKVQILHLGLEKMHNPNFSLERYLSEINPKLVGISLHWHYQSYYTIETVKRIKLVDRSVFTVLGGLTASYFHKEIMEEFSFVDAIIRGDGEVPFLKLLEKISSDKRELSDVPNLTWRVNETIRINPIGYVAQNEDLDKLNFTNFKLLRNYQLYLRMNDARGGRWVKGVRARIISKFGPPTYFPLFISKGCLVNCSYCGGSRSSQQLTSGRDSVSVRSPEKVIESIKEAKSYNYREIRISYLPFHNHRTYFIELFETIKKERIGINYFLECWDLPPREIIERYKQIRIPPFKLCMGLSPESGNERVRRLNKGFYYSNAELMRSLSYISSLDIPVILYFSVGLPGETIRDIEETVRFQRLLRKRFRNIISISTVNPVLEPASPMFEMSLRYGITKARLSFRDFLRTSRGMDSSGYLTTQLGYFSRGFLDVPKGRHLSGETSYQRYLQDIICKSSCRLAEFLFPIFLRTKITLLWKLAFACSRLICNLIYIYWRLIFSLCSRVKIKR
jgi:radical SAM superfamily enzyme YgiQ (UPF0313 family)